MKEVVGRGKTDHRIHHFLFTAVLSSVSTFTHFYCIYLLLLSHHCIGCSVFDGGHRRVCSTPTFLPVSSSVNWKQYVCISPRETEMTPAEKNVALTQSRAEKENTALCWGKLGKNGVCVIVSV